ncbi:RNA polymerase Rpb3/Rpb11 dimerization domain protein [Oesophagostomum dentatum]|uniref:RNA polymerase Rpb3/Rpb11 dimerization domain protein n=1 Tax=Oesophagostomum dentatum TaxID=61180 RepID=A0A0B1T4B4_OESDE|nr:RNA polymerase Rpb3/Rpb11 dimerization domain protein [Oesophagostomum dentatum]
MVLLDPEGFAQDPTCLTIVLREEDHTIGNSLKHIMCRMKNVEFCGYNVPHPLEDKILLRIQTKEGIPAGPVLLEALTHLEKMSARGQLMSVHIGQCGNQIGQSFWKTLCDEHAIDG